MRRVGEPSLSSVHQLTRDMGKFPSRFCGICGVVFSQLEGLLAFLIAKCLYWYFVLLVFARRCFWEFLNAPSVVLLLWAFAVRHRVLHHLQADDKRVDTGQWTAVSLAPLQRRTFCIIYLPSRCKPAMNLQLCTGKHERFTKPRYPRSDTVRLAARISQVTNIDYEVKVLLFACQWFSADRTAICGSCRATVAGGAIDTTVVTSLTRRIYGNCCGNSSSNLCNHFVDIRCDKQGYRFWSVLLATAMKKIIPE